MEVEYKQSLKIFITFILAFVLAIFINNMHYFSPRFILSSLIILAILLWGCFVKKAKAHYLFIFSLSLCFIIEKYIGKLWVSHLGGPKGFYIASYDFPLFALYFINFYSLYFGKKFINALDKYNKSFILLIFFSVLSIFNAQFPNFSLFYVFRIFIIFMVFYYMSNFLDLKKEKNAIIFGSLLGLLIESILCIIQYLRKNFIGFSVIASNTNNYNYSFRVSGTFGHPNMLGRYLGFLIPIPLSFLFSGIKARFKFICIIISFISIIVLILVQSRAAWFGFLCSLAVLLILQRKAKLFTFKGSIVKIIAIFFVLISITLIFGNIISRRIHEPDYGSAFSRIPLMQVAINIIKNHPFLGIGVNNYAEVMQKYDVTLQGISFSFDNVVHNSYLLLASEFGILGVMVFLIMVIIFYLESIASLKSRDHFLVCFLIGILSGFASFFVQLLVMPAILVDNSFLVFWFLFGVGVSIIKHLN